MSRKAPLVGVSGQIAAGKSTLVSRLATELGFQPLLEREAENPYLERYYRDPAHWAFQNLLFFFEQSATDRVRGSDKSTGSVQERSPQEHIEVFGREFRARGFLSEEDFALVERLERVTTSILGPPDLLIYLDIDPQTALERINDRARNAESEVSLEYLEALDIRYERFIDSWRQCPVLRIDSVALDARRDDDLRHITDLVIQHLSSVETSSATR